MVLGHEPAERADKNRMDVAEVTLAQTSRSARTGRYCWQVVRIRIRSRTSNSTGGTTSSQCATAGTRFSHAGSAAHHFPLSLRAHPRQTILYVDLVTIQQVAVYRYDEDGRLQFVKTVADRCSCCRM